MRSITHDSITLQYEVLGDGPALILGHSFLCSSAMWRRQFTQLAQHFKVINVDARGHGRSGPVDVAFTLDDMVGDMLAVLDAEEVDAAIWGGLSMGGMVAMRAALAHPQRVERLILLDTDAGLEPRGSKMQHRALAAVVRTFGVRPVARRICKLMFGRTTLDEQEDLVEEWRRRFLEAHVPSMLRTLTAIDDRDDISHRLKEIAVPTLVIAGSEDAALPAARSRLISEAIPGAEYFELPTAGHLSALEKPAEVTRAMLDFLRP